MKVSNSDANAGVTPRIPPGPAPFQTKRSRLEAAGHAGAPEAPDGQLSELDTAYAEIAQLRKALSSNRDIGAATGVVMVQYSLRQHDAFELLRRLSQSSHRRLHDVALDVLESGMLPATVADIPPLTPRPRPPLS